MLIRFLLSLLCVCSLSACGGGGGGGGSVPNGGAPPPASIDSISMQVSGATAPVPSGTNTDLHFQITNPSTSAANAVSLAVTLGAGLTRAGLRCSAGPAAICPTDPDAMTVATLPAGGSLRFSMSVIVEAGASGVISSSAVVAASNDAVTSNNSGSIDITAYSADISVSGSATANEFTAGSKVTYTFTVANAGPDLATDLLFDNVLHGYQILDSIICSGTGGGSCPASVTEIMTIPSLPSGGALTFTLTSELTEDVLVSISDRLRVTALGDPDIKNNWTTPAAVTRIPTSAQSSSFLALRSDFGDFIGQGDDYSYTLANSTMEIYAVKGVLTIKVRGDDSWDGSFYMPADFTDVRPGTYVDLLGAPSHDPATGGLRWTGRGRACNTVIEHTGWFVVDDIEYSDGQVASLDLRFHQHCERGAPPIRGQIHWSADDQTIPPGPVNPPPPDLWEPEPGSTPPTGNYIYLQSDLGDFVGQGRTEVLTAPVGSFGVTLNGALLEIGKGGDPSFNSMFIPMVPLARVQAGYYPDAMRAGFGNPTRGGLDVFFENRGCNRVGGWFAVDHIEFSQDEVSAIDLRFEQLCEYDPRALRGKIHWRSSDSP